MATNILYIRFNKGVNDDGTWQETLPFPNQSWNGRFYAIKPGAVFVDCQNEELDSAEIVLPQIPNDELPNIQRLDFCEIFSQDAETGVVTPLNKDSGGRRVYVIDTIRKENYRTMPNSPKYWTITLKLMSLTKRLENIVLPSLSITQPLSGEHKRSVYSYMQEYVDLYGEKVRTANGFTNLYSLPIFAPNIFDVPCPEMQWNKPTLREVLTDLMLVVDCIPIIRYDGYYSTIDYINISERGSEIDDGIITYEKSEQQSSEYASELRSDIDNVMQSGEDYVDNTVNCIERKSWRLDSETDYILNDQNLMIVTENPIIKVRKLVMSMYVRPDGNASGKDVRFIKIDITDFVSEDRDWNAKPSWYDTDALHDWFYQLSLEDMKSYRNFSLHFSRGDNKIKGFEQNNSEVMGNDVYTATAFVRKLGYYFNSQYRSSLTSGGSGYSYGDPSVPIQNANGVYPFGGSDQTGYEINGGAIEPLYGVWFDVEYETMANCAAKVGRHTGSKHLKEVSDSQTNSYVDATRQGLFEYSKVNRLGNEITLAHARLDSLSNLPQLASTHNGRTIFKRDISYERNCFEVDFYECPNYLLRNYWTGVNARVRTWAIVSGSEAFIRHEIGKVYAEFSYVQKDEKAFPLTDYNPSSNLAFEFLYPLSSDDKIPTLANNYVTRFNVFDTGKDYVSDLVKRAFGNSLLLTFKATDNFAIGYCASREYITSLGNTKTLSVPYAYVAQRDYQLIASKRYNKGETDFPVSMSVVSKVNLPNERKDGEIVTEDASDWHDEIVDAIAQGNALGEVAENIATFENVFAVAPNRSYSSYLKDQREIFGYTQQIEFCADNDGIYVSPLFVKYQRAICKKPVIHDVAQYVEDNTVLLDGIYVNNIDPGTGDLEYTDGNDCLNTKAPNPTYNLAIYAEQYDHYTYGGQQYPMYHFKVYIYDADDGDWSDYSSHISMDDLVARNCYLRATEIEKTWSDPAPHSFVNYEAWFLRGTFRKFFYIDGASDFAYNYEGISFDANQFILLTDEIPQYVVMNATGQREDMVNPALSSYLTAANRGKFVIGSDRKLFMVNGDNDNLNGFNFIYIGEVRENQIFKYGSGWLIFSGGSLLEIENSFFKVYGSLTENRFGNGATNSLDNCIELQNVFSPGSSLVSIANVSNGTAYVRVALENVDTPSQYVGGFAITDENDNVLLSWNDPSKSTLYLNILAIHNDFVYSETDPERIVGTIKH